MGLRLGRFTSPRSTGYLLGAVVGALFVSTLVGINRGHGLLSFGEHLAKMGDFQQGTAEAAPTGDGLPSSAATVVSPGALPTSLPPLKLGPFASFVLPKGKAKCGLIWIHGLGDTEEGWADGLEDDFRVSPKAGPCRFLLPRAPVQMVTCNEGRTTSWFDIDKLPLRDTDAPPHHGCSLEQALASCGRVHAAIEKLIEEGIPPERIVVGGFSQGGAMALLSTLTFPQRLAGIIVFSGIVFFADRLPQLIAEHNKGYEVFWGHGLQDDVLDVSLQAEGVDALTDAGMRVTAKQYKTTHSSTPDEMEDAAGFFSKLLTS